MASTMLPPPEMFNPKHFQDQTYQLFNNYELKKHGSFKKSFVSLSILNFYFLYRYLFVSPKLSELSAVDCGKFVLHRLRSIAAHPQCLPEKKTTKGTMAPRRSSLVGLD